MRTTKRFTPEVLRRFEREGRGKGILFEYLSWHRVSRSDPSSIGRSHITFREGFEHDQLSDLEHSLLFAAVSTQPEDIRFQLPLHLRPHTHELNEYEGVSIPGTFPGTLDIAEELGIKAPVLRSSQETKEWISSTDMVLTYLQRYEMPRLIAISGKYPNDLLERRKLELLRIECEYWTRRGVIWLLITIDEFERRVRETLMRSMAWGLIPTASPQKLNEATTIAMENVGQSLTYVLRRIEAHCGDHSAAQQFFWQSVWHGALRYNLRTGWRPHLPVWTVSEAQFTAFNPILSRRSAWKG